MPKSTHRTMLLLLWIMSWGWVETEERYQPHILLVVMDDLGAGDLGYHNSGVQTPVADRLALNGLRLKNFAPSLHPHTHRPHDRQVSVSHGNLQYRRQQRSMGCPRR